VVPRGNKLQQQSGTAVFVLTAAVDGCKRASAPILLVVVVVLVLDVRAFQVPGVDCARHSVRGPDLLELHVPAAGALWGGFDFADRAQGDFCPEGPARNASRSDAGGDYRTQPGVLTPGIRFKTDPP
jgi:hypothetical protein